MRTPTLLLAALLTAGPLKAWAAKPADADSPIGEVVSIAPFVQEMALRHGFDAAALEALFAEVRFKRGILEAMARPAEAKPWYEYRRLFVEPRRVRQGVAFWNQHAATLARAEAQFGVPAALIVAIIGVETSYGRNTGTYRVMDALSTLAFGHPRRGAFFRDQLEAYLLLTREQGLAPLAGKGSYAGAVGIPQFMPTSYREYAVDFDGDGRADLWTNPADAIGSVANYFVRKGWRPGAPVVARAALSGEGEERAELINRGWGYRHTLEVWRRMGVTAAVDAGTEEAMLLELAGTNGAEYWLGFGNFFVITRYNNSFHYAMAVWDLAQALAATRAK